MICFTIDLLPLQLDPQSVLAKLSTR